MHKHITHFKHQVLVDKLLVQNITNSNSKCCNNISFPYKDNK